MADGRHYRDHEDGIYVPPSREAPQQQSPWAPRPPSDEPTVVEGEWSASQEEPYEAPDETPPEAPAPPEPAHEWAPPPLPTNPRRMPTLRNSEFRQRSGGESFPRRTDPYTGEPNPYAPPPDFHVAVAGDGPPVLPPRSERSSARGWWLAVAAVVIAIGVAAGILIGLNFAHRSGSSGAGTTCGGKPVLRVTTTPDFADVVKRAAKDIGGTGGCQPVAVSVQEPADTLAGLADAPLDAWIPPSSAWLRQSGTSPTSSPAPLSGGTPVSLARSPVVVAVPQAFAQSLGWPAKQPGWADITGLVTTRKLPKFSMGDPQRDTAAMLSVLGIQTAMARTTPDPGIAQMRGLTLRARLADPAADTSALLRRLGEQTDAAQALKDVGGFPVTEQALWTYTHADHKVPLAALYPADGLLEADYPLALTARTASDADRSAIAGRLTDRIRSREFTSTLTAAGFRPAAQSASTGGSGASSAPEGAGLVAQYPAPATLPAALGTSTRIWATYKRLTYQTLILVDGSASMNAAVVDRSGRTTTKAQLLQAAGVQASQLFGEDTSVGMWLFASPPGNTAPYTVAVPFGPINDSIGGVPRRTVMQQAAAGYKAYPSAGTPLFETVLRGVADMKARTKPDTVTMVVVLTDGRDEDSHYSMDRQQFLQKLGNLRDPARPVPVFAIGYGSDADMTTLTDMAQLTGGQAVASNDPGDLASAIAKIFLAAHGQA
jgi:hypothetical protein